MYVDGIVCFKKKDLCNQIKMKSNLQWIFLLGTAACTWMSFNSLRESIGMYFYDENNVAKTGDLLVSMYYDDDDGVEGNEGELQSADNHFDELKSNMAEQIDTNDETDMEVPIDIHKSIHVGEGDDEREEKYDDEGVLLEEAAVNFLNPTNSSLYPFYTNGCCGIGHRLSRVVPSIVYANRQRRKAKIYWPDVGWNILFDNNEYFEASFEGQTSSSWQKADELGLSILNDAPQGWSPYIDRSKFVVTKTIFDKYRAKEQWVENPWIFGVLIQMKRSLSPLVLSFLTSIREGLQSNKDQGGVSICIHIRHGNAEKGDWQNKKHRHIDIDDVENKTISTMKAFVREKNATNVSVFIASDNTDIRPRFERKLYLSQDQSEENISWNILKPKEIERPKEGVWFGQINKDNSNTLNQTMKEAAMAEATAQVFGLGECDVLMVPNYSTFNFPAIILTLGRKKQVYFGSSTGDFSLNEFSRLCQYNSEKDSDCINKRN